MKVMLAKKFEPKRHNVDGWFASEKLDGVRAVWTGDQLVTRNGNPITAPPWFLASLPADVALDGELFIDRGKFQSTVGIVRSKTADDRWEPMTYQVFDMPNNPAVFRDKVDDMQFVCESLDDRIMAVEQTEIVTADVPAMLARLESLGAEGVMLRHPESLYERRRSTKLLKVKSFLDADATVVAHQAGQGKHAGRLGALLCRLSGGAEFYCGTGFTDAQRETPPAIGAKIRFTYFELTDGGLPRFPAFSGVRD